MQTLDGEAHRARKAMFMSLMAPESLRRLGATSDHWWRLYARRWERAERVELYAEARELLCRVACGWAGVPLPESDVALRTAQLSALFESSARAGPSHWRDAWRGGGRSSAGSAISSTRSARAG